MAGVCKTLIKELSKQLTEDFGKAFSKRNIDNKKKLYIAFPKMQTQSAQLIWSHYKLHIKVKDKQAREWYIKYMHSIISERNI